MLPVILTIGSFKLYSYGVFLTVALFVGLYWWWKLGRDENLEETALFDTFFLGVLASFIVGRVAYVAIHLPDFSNIYRVLGVLSFPGISLIGGIFGVTLAVIAFAYYQEWEIPKILDNLAVTVGIIMMIGSIGGILNGSIPGIIAQWGIKYPGLAEPRFPVDIVVFVWSLIYFVVATRVRKEFRFYAWYKQNRTVAPDGLTALVSLAMFGSLYMIRGFLENTWRVSVVPYYTLGGFVVVLLSILMIYLRSGRVLFGKK